MGLGETVGDGQRRSNASSARVGWASAAEDSAVPKAAWLCRQGVRRPYEATLTDSENAQSTDADGECLRAPKLSNYGLGADYRFNGCNRQLGGFAMTFESTEIQPIMSR